MPIEDAMEPAKITDAPLDSSGSAFCTANSRPRTLVLKVLSKCSSVISPNAVEMEAAALCAFAQATGAQVLCPAHVTNTTGQAEQDFEKGEADGTADARAVLETIIVALQKSKVLDLQN